MKKYVALYKCQYCDRYLEVEVPKDQAEGLMLMASCGDPQRTVHHCTPYLSAIAVFVGYKVVGEDDDGES